MCLIACVLDCVFVGMCVYFHVCMGDYLHVYSFMCSITWWLFSCVLFACVVVSVLACLLV